MPVQNSFPLCPLTGTASSGTVSGPTSTGPAGRGRKKGRRLELSEDQKREVREAFDLFDGNKTGKIGFHELKVALKAFGFDVSKPTMQTLRKDYDKQGGGTIDFVDFSEIMTRKISERDPVDEMRKAFRLFDDDNTGSISLKNLRNVARELGEPLSDDELQAMIDEFDNDGDGEINEEEFLAIMQQSNMY